MRVGVLKCTRYDIGDIGDVCVVSKQMWTVLWGLALWSCLTCTVDVLAQFGHFVLLANARICLWYSSGCRTSVYVFANCQYHFYVYNLGMRAPGIGYCSALYLLVP